MREYEKEKCKINAKLVLERVNYYIENYRSPLCTRKVCGELSIFDWWTDYISKSKLLEMQKFLKEAIKLGYTGYVCFKVGAKYCANGMWAHKEMSTDGYSPSGEAIYKSFTPDYNYWSYCDKEENWFPKGDNFDKLNTIKKFEKHYFEHNFKNQ